MMKKIIYCVSFLLLINMIFSSCADTNVNSYKTFVLNEGTVHFSLEYRTYYRVDRVKPGDDTGLVSKDTMDFELISPKIKQTNDYTRIEVIVEKPNTLLPDAKSAIERAERNASSWADYKLLDKYELTIDGVQAYRIDYQNINIIPAIAGVPGKPISVYREVHFDAKGFVWMIQMRSDSSTAEADKADFEHILQTFKILD